MAPGILDFKIQQGRLEDVILVDSCGTAEFSLLEPAIEGLLIHIQQQHCI